MGNPGEALKKGEHHKELECNTKRSSSAQKKHRRPKKIVARGQMGENLIHTTYKNSNPITKQKTHKMVLECAKKSIDDQRNCSSWSDGRKSDPHCGLKSSTAIRVESDPNILHISHHTGFTRRNEDFECHEFEVQGGPNFEVMHMEKSQERSKWIQKEKDPKWMVVS